MGLGNPGRQYEGTRHNAGADVIALLATRHGDKLKKAKERALVADVRIDGKQLAMAFPQTYMNDSGNSVGPARGALHLDLDHVVVIHDEIALPFGRIESRVGGGLAGHNGLKSIRDHMHGDEFLRVRIGIGKPPG